MLRLTFLILFLATASSANDYPPVPEGGLMAITSSSCSDVETGIEGLCYLLQDVPGNLYVTFWVNDEMMFIRQLVGEDYETIWTNPRYNSI
jgi:hypothetical protein